MFFSSTASSVRARYDGSVTDSNSRFGYDIYRIADIDDHFAGHEAEYAAAGYGERKIEKLKEKDMYGKVLIDRADGTVRSFFLPILIDLDGANDDEGCKDCCYGLAQPICRYGKI